MFGLKFFSAKKQNKIAKIYIVVFILFQTISNHTENAVFVQIHLDYSGIFQKIIIFEILDYI